MSLMVPLSKRPRPAKRSRAQRRHRIHGDEIPEVLEGLKLRLRQHLEMEEDLAMATVAFRAFYRLLTHQTGRPNYPDPVTWNTIAEWVRRYKNGTI